MIFNDEVKAERFFNVLVTVVIFTIMLVIASLV